MAGRIALYNVPGDPGQQATCRVCHRNANAQHRPMVHGSYEAQGGRMIQLMVTFKCGVGHRFRVQWSVEAAKA